jgi:hypothetical protein
MVGSIGQRAVLAAGARAFPRWWNIGEGRRARGLRFPSANLTCVRAAPCASKGRTEEPTQTRVTASGDGSPIAEFCDWEPDPTSPLRITLPRPLHLPSGGAPKRASRLRGNGPLHRQGTHWGSLHSSSPGPGCADANLPAPLGADAALAGHLRTWPIMLVALRCRLLAATRTMVLTPCR